MSLNRVEKELQKNKSSLDKLFKYNNLLNDSLVDQAFKEFSEKRMYHLSLLSGLGIIIALWGQLHHTDLLSLAALICSFGFWTNMHILNYMLPKDLSLLPLFRRRSVRVFITMIILLILYFGINFLIKDWVYLVIIEGINYFTLSSSIRLYIKFGRYVQDNKLQDLFPKESFR